MGNMSANEPLASGLVGHRIHDAQALIKGKAPEFAHSPGASSAAGTQALDVANVAPHSFFIELLVRCEGSNQCSPLAPQCFPGPFLCLVLLVARHVSSPSSRATVPRLKITRLSMWDLNDKYS